MIVMKYSNFYEYTYAFHGIRYDNDVISALNTLANANIFLRPILHQRSYFQILSNVA